MCHILWQSRKFGKFIEFRRKVTDSSEWTNAQWNTLRQRVTILTPSSRGEIFRMIYFRDQKMAYKCYFVSKKMTLMISNCYCQLFSHATGTVTLTVQIIIIIIISIMASVRLIDQAHRRLSSMDIENNRLVGANWYVIPATLNSNFNSMWYRTGKWMARTRNLIVLNSSRKANKSTFSWCTKVDSYDTCCFALRLCH